MKRKIALFFTCVVCLDAQALYFPFWSRLKYVVFISTLAVAIASCSEMKSKQGITEKADSTAAPQVTILSELQADKLPQETFLDKSVVPSKKYIPIHPGNETNFQNKPADKGSDRFVAEMHLLLDEETQKPLAAEVQGAGFFTTYNTDNGLALDAVLCSAKDSKGNLWFGTAGGGVSRYNGKRFVNYTSAQGLAYNTVNCIVEDKEGNLWFGTAGGGVSKFDGRIFVNYTTAEGLVNNSVSSMVEDISGNLWIGTAGGVSRFDKKKFVNFTTDQGLANNTVWSIVEDIKRNLWICTSGGISRYDGNSFVNFSVAQGLKTNVVLCAAEDGEGNLWFGQEEGGVCKYDGKTFVNYGLKQGFSGKKVVCITEDMNRNLWFGTYGNGVSKYDGKSFANFTTSQGLAGNVVASVTEDKTGNLWFGIYGGGVSKYAGKSFVNYTTIRGLANNVVRSIAQDKLGNLWFGTNGGGVSKYDGKSFLNFTSSQGLANNLAYSITEDDDGILWIGTFGGGISRYDGKSFVSYTTSQGLAGNLVQCITKDASGNLWIGTNGGGASKFNGKSFLNYTTVQGLGHNTVQCVTQDKSGNIWFGTNNGVTVFNGDILVNYTTSQGLINNIVNAVTQDVSGNLWIGTEEGLSLLRFENIALLASGSWELKSLKVPLFENFTTQNGLPDNYVTQIIQADTGKLFVGTNLGICELLHVKTENQNRDEWKAGRIFNTQTGYPVKDVNAGQNTMFRDNKGIIWIATGSDKTGLVRFDPQQLRATPVPPVPVIQSIKINNESVSFYGLLSPSKHQEVPIGFGKTHINPSINEEVTTFGRVLSANERNAMQQTFGDIEFDNVSKWYALPENLVLTYRHNNISIDFGSISPGSFNSIYYQYMLEGYDKNWSPLSNVSTASFGNIFEGEYTFRVRAYNFDGLKGETLSYTFRVLPPWYRTWWMYSVYLIVFLAALRTFSKWRERRIVDEKEKLEIKVERRTVELNQSLKELKATQSQLIQSEKMASLGELTAGIAHEIQNPLNFVNNFSEVNTELIEEMKQEIDKGNLDEVKTIANDIADNERKITQHGKRADAIVKGMLQHSRSSIGLKEPTNINAIADEYLRLAYHGLRAKDKSFNATLHTDFDESIGKINAIPQDIGRVILNLITNAFYSVTEKKQLNIPGYEPTVSVSTRLFFPPTGGPRGVEIKVKDNGNGIPQKVLDKIYQPFFTTKPTGQGTGLGLSMSYEIVTKAHGGELKVETKEGQGAEFTIILPV